MKNETRYFSVNQATWNRKTLVHKESDFYDVPGFLRGNSTLHTYEKKALGDVRGKSLLHLQCHFGLDTLSWVREGAQCMGIDISENAIETARDLAHQATLQVEFIGCNVLDTHRHITQLFDIVFTSYGVINWLPNLNDWAQVIYKCLKPGGTFYIVEFHPIAWMFDDKSTSSEIMYAYEKKEAIYEEYQGTYTDMTAEVTSKEYTWNHGLGSVITALARTGLRIEFCREHNGSPYHIFPNLVRNKTDGYYYQSGQLYPLLFEIKALKTQ